MDIKFFNKRGVGLNTEEYLGIRDIYKASLMPAAVIGGENGMICSNSAFDDNFDEEMRTYFGGLHTGTSYEKTVFCGGSVVKAYITALNEKQSVINLAMLDRYLYFDSQEIAAKVRDAVNSVCMNADEIWNKYPDEYIADKLNGIDEAMLTLMSDILIPEEIAVLFSTDISCFAAVSITEAVNRFAAELDEILGGRCIEIKTCTVSGIYSILDTNALTLIMSDCMVKAMSGNTPVGSIYLGLERNGPGKAVLTFSCKAGNGNAIEHEKRHLQNSGESDPVYDLCSLMSKKFKCSVTYAVNPGIYSVIVEMPLSAVPYSNKLREPQKLFLYDTHFSNPSVFLTKLGINKRYPKE